MSSSHVCTFHIDDRMLGVPVAQVHEIVRFMLPTPVPLAPALVRGLVNLRGQIVPAIDLRRCFGLPPLPADHQPLHVVVEAERTLVSLMIDDIGDVQPVDAPLLPPPEHLKGPSRALIAGVYTLGEHVIAMLSTQAVVHAVIAALGQPERPGRARAHERTRHEFTDSEGDM